jgi:alkylation response protein AidB-like acyl-CoA dehydrogenase
MFGLGFAAISLGVARGMLDAAIELARGKASVGIKAMRDNHAVQGLVGRTEGNWRAARAYIYGSAAEAWRDLTQTGKLSEEHRAALRLASTWTIHQAAAVVDAAYHMAGATAVFRANKFERRFRDMHAIAQQIQGRDTHYEDVGRMILTASAIPRGPTA